MTSKEVRPHTLSSSPTMHAKFDEEYGQPVPAHSVESKVVPVQRSIVREPPRAAAAPRSIAMTCLAKLVTP